MTPGEAAWAHPRRVLGRRLGAREEPAGHHLSQYASPIPARRPGGSESSAWGGVVMIPTLNRRRPGHFRLPIRVPAVLDAIDGRAGRGAAVPGAGDPSGHPCARDLAPQPAAATDPDRHRCLDPAAPRFSRLGTRDPLRRGTSRRDGGRDRGRRIPTVDVVPASRGPACSPLAPPCVPRHRNTTARATIWSAGRLAESRLAPRAGLEPAA